MATVKLRIDGRTTKEGICRVKVQVIHEREKAEKTLFTVRPEQWDKDNGTVRKSDPHHRDKNRIAQNALRRYLDVIYQFEAEGLFYTAKDVLRESKERLVDTIDQFCSELGTSVSKKKVYVGLTKHIEAFDKDATIKRITKGWMDKFQKFLFSQKRIKANNTVRVYLNALLTVLRWSHAGKYLPHEVLKYKVPSRTKGHKVKLTKKEVTLIKNHKGNELARDAFLLCIYTRGSRIGDVLRLKPENIVDGRIDILEQKTRKIKSVLITENIQEIIDRWAGQSEYYVLPILKQMPSESRESKRYHEHVIGRNGWLNRQLKRICEAVGIEKNVTSHVARHSFASWIDRQGTSTTLIRDMLGHSSITQTEEYLDDLHSDDELDDLAGDVLDGI